MIKASLLGDGVVYELEHRFAELLHNRFHCLSVINATSGLAAVLRCFPPGKVIAPLFTSPATWAAIGHAGHDAVFCDIDPVSVCLSPQAVSSYIQSTMPQAKRGVRAIVAVNIFGHMSDLKSLSALAHELGAVLLVDAAQSLATCLCNPAHASLADVLVFSLGPSKWLGCADGGLIAVKKLEIWEQLVRLTQHPTRQILDVPNMPANFEHYNYRINPYTAAEALMALEDIKERITCVREQQRQLIKQLERTQKVEPLLSDRDVIFEPLTVFPRQSKLQDWTLSDLLIPVRAALSNKYGLDETTRQFAYRKVVCHIDGQYERDIKSKRNIL